jgi:type I restriction enzyme S subunit
MTWRLTRLKYLTSVPITNGLGEAAQDSDPSWPRYIRTTDIASTRHLHGDRLVSLPPETARPSMVQANDLLMCAAGSLGKVYLHQGDEPACYAGYLVRFRPRLDLVDPRFIAFWAESQPFLEQIAVGAVRSTIDNFSAGKYQQMELDVPSLDEQRRIADFLDAETARIDRLVDLRDRQVRCAHERFQSAIAATVVKAPEPWPKLAWLLRLLRDGTHTPPARVLEGVPLLTAKNVRNNTLEFTSGNYSAGFGAVPLEGEGRR